MKRWLSRLSIAVGSGFVVLIAWLWFSLFSPWGYVPPPGLPPVEPATLHRVFTYGTLSVSVVRWLVIGRSPPVQPATLPDFRKQGLNLIPQAGAHTPKNTTSPERSKPSPSQKAEQSPDSNLLTPSELESLKKATLSFQESTKKLFPQIKFV